MIYYRLPDTDKGVIIEPTHAPERLNALEELEDRHGFVVAPFHISAETPIYLFPDEEQKYYQIPPKVMPTASVRPPIVGNQQGERMAYHNDFMLFRQQLVNGRFQKIVLARRQREAITAPFVQQVLFERACQLFPHCFVALVELPEQGVWFTATPEILLQTEGEIWTTIALAGTMRKDDERHWNRKSQQEQRVVAHYIEDTLRPMASHIQQNGPYDFMAGGLKHLRTDFRFVLNPQVRIGHFLAALHPTPAVCGMPKQGTYDFILSKESAPRDYYSGFMGPFQANRATHLYVSLRCVHITGQQFDFYAGGGLLPYSEEEMEWEETVAKIAQIRNVLFHHQ